MFGMNKNLFTTILEISGGILITVGVGLIHPPTAIIVLGILLIVVGGLSA